MGVDRLLWVVFCVSLWFPPWVSSWTLGILLVWVVGKQLFSEEKLRIRRHNGFWGVVGMAVWLAFHGFLNGFHCGEKYLMQGLIFSLVWVIPVLLGSLRSFQQILRENFTWTGWTIFLGNIILSAGVLVIFWLQHSETRFVIPHYRLFTDVVGIHPNHWVLLWLLGYAWTVSTISPGHPGRILLVSAITVLGLWLIASRLAIVGALAVGIYTGGRALKGMSWQGSFWKFLLVGGILAGVGILAWWLWKDTPAFLRFHPSYLHQRMVPWICGWQVARETFPLWTGMGSCTLIPRLTRCYEEAGETILAQLRASTHSQFLETYLEGGMFSAGLLVLWMVMLVVYWGRSCILFRGEFLVLLTGWLFFLLLDTPFFLHRPALLWMMTVWWSFFLPSSSGDARVPPCMHNLVHP